VDFLNGEVVTRARAHGVPVPVNERIRDTVWDLSRGTKKPGLAALRELYDATGPHGG
jgi:2-dehydropantoate 2-reductase